MTIIVFVARVLHIVAGIVWAGGSLMAGLVLEPSIAATGEAGKQFAGYLFKKSSFSKLMAASGLSTVLAGALLYGVNSNWFRSGWMMSGQGIGFGIGAGAGILAMIFGIRVGKINEALANLGMQIQGKPSEAQAADLQVLQKQQVAITRADVICMLISIFFMASARFFS
ncbi:MAG: hypothetical protein IT311_04840 [Anaerolineales bacterium]|nr:hypothetical protein [Anaerolineales bacterium]MCZ2122814.1 hypothetical protein [Anaerolineales bacterium]